MNDQDELRDEARFRMFVDDDNHRSLFEAFVSQTNKDLGPIDKNWFYNERSSQVSACSGSDVGTALDSPSSQQSSSTCVSGATPRSSRPAELFSPCASALEWTPSPPSKSDMFKTPAVPNPRSLLHSLGVGAAGPSPQWSPSLQTPPNGHSSEKKDMDIRKDDNLHLAPRSLFRSSTASFRSYSSEMEDVPEGKPKDIPYGDEDDEVPRQKPPSSCFGDGVTPQASRTEPKRLPVEALARCIQQGNWDEQELLESLSMAEDRSEQALPQLPSPCVTPSSSQIFVNNDNKTEDIDAHTKADMFVDQSVVDIPLIVDIDARDSSNILTVDVATSSQASGSPPARRRSATARRKLMGDPRGPVPLHSAANLGRPGKLELVAESVCAGSAGESLRDGSTSEESRMDLAFAKSQNDFLKVGYSFTQMVEVAESTMACLEAPDVGFTQSEPSEAAVSSESILGCLLGMDSTKQAKKVAADVPPSQVAFQSLTAVPVPKAIYLPSTAEAQASHSVCSDEVIEVIAEDVAPKITTGFTTGSGKVVTVLSKSLNAAQCLLLDVGGHQIEEKKRSAVSAGRVVTVARDSLTTAQGLLHDVTKEVASFDGLPNGKSDVAARSDVVTGFTTCTRKPASVHSDSLDAASRVLGASTKNASLDDLEEMPDALRQQDIRGRLLAPPLASVSCLSVAQGTPQRLANGLVANSSPGIASEAQRTPQSASAMFKSRLKGVARAPSFVTPFKAVGKPQTPTVAAKTTVAPPRSLFRKSQIQPGKLWIMRRVLKKDRISLKEAFEGNAPRFYSCEELAAFGVSGVTASVNSISAANFEFSAPPPDALIILGDGATVQPSPGQSRLGKSELYRDCFIFQLTAFGVSGVTASVNSISAANFEFSTPPPEALIILGDGATVQLSPGQSRLGKSELYSAFLGVPGVDSSLISREWFDNHYRWIVWKLASLEQHGPHVFAGRSLTPDNVMLQMKYRYDVEIDHSTRSALRKIIERDDIASGTLILCVSGINREENALRVELTDGWYGLRAEFDEPLSKLVSENRIFVGQKLITSGADIVGSTDACTPLEVPDELALRLNFNSTRRARWDAKLGYLRARQPFRVSLGSLNPKGGAVGRVDCIVIRAYPVMYLEMLSNKTAVMRSERAELVVAAKHDKLRSAFTEKLTAEVLSQVEKDDTEGLSLETLSGVQVSYSVKQIQGLTSGQDIWKALCCSADSVEIERILTPNQLRLLNEYQDQQLNQKQLALQQKLEQAFQQAEEEGKASQARRTFSRGCVLSVWRPTDELRQMLVEGRAVSVYNVHVSPVRNVLPDVQNCAVELTTSKGTRYETVDCPEHVRIYYSRQASSVTSFPVLLSENGSPGRAVDIVGLVFLVSRQSERDIFYLADSKLNFVQLVVAKQSQAVLADDSVGPGHFVAATDVVLRPRNRELGKVAVVATTDFSEVTCSPHKSHLCSALVMIKEFIPAVLADDSVGPGHFVAATDVVLRPRNRELGKVAVVATTDFSEVTCSPHKSHLCSALVTIKEFIPDPSGFVTAALKRFQTPTPTPPTTPNAVLKTLYTYETTPNRLPWQQATAKTAPAPPKQPVFQLQPRTPAVANDGLDLSGRKSVKPGSAADLRSKQIRARIALLERYTALAPVPTLASPPSKETRKPYRKPVIANRDDKAASPESSPPMDLDTD
ncbi:breast cancer type 2 susceptibility protein brca2, putative [Ixodes scapularis]|uniref:Breast cancer type 2 susceptibility protein brca2, putative n=1 Tax=Ixodes scapularis TaxID=6945 RepID=B7PB26_IXOSC|nr:breast cancer type 2 susceptibility protein brca2, putative [Ixodes scapularis]|eukprot:XP_002407637.1 breast cancer type 2 susceptibility protein brca2, putative [Ixodes scapularis]